MNSVRLPTPKILILENSRVSERFAEGIMQTRHPFLTAVSIMGRIPRTPLISPLSPSSPAIQTPFSLFVSRYPKAPRRAAAMGRSNLVPSLRMSAGERFTVILFGGKDDKRLRKLWQRRQKGRELLKSISKRR